MKLALRLVWFTAWADIDSVLHRLDGFFDDCPEWIGEARCNFCQWSHGGWNDTLDMIDAEYPKE